MVKYWIVASVDKGSIPFIYHLRFYLFYMNSITWFSLPLFFYTKLNKIIWLNYIREGFLIDQFWKMILNNFILYWIINGAQFFNFTWINRLLFTFYYNNLFLTIYFNTVELIQYSLTLLFWKLGLIGYMFLLFINFTYYLI